MDVMAGDRQARGISARRRLKTADKVREAAGMSRRKQRAGTPVLVLVPPRAAARNHLRSSVRHSSPQAAAGDHARSVPENVENLEGYRPGIKIYHVSINFSGEAGAGIRDLMTDLGAESPNEVVKRAVALLLSVRGKEIIVREPRTGMLELVEA